ncbi:MAG: 4-hydroxy-3-methylbut-2-enyl diphosphate reductase [Bacilli bacterium]|nr:4-hydroxy-3-methylbut-2-enyl diphosphate reductase [Bacilli bacterium]
MKTYLSNPSGYCQGVSRAIALSLSFKKKYPKKDCYVLGALVHNETVTNDLKKYGIICLEDKISSEEKIKKIPQESIVIFSAHGHDKKLETLLTNKKIVFLDATCPIVDLSAQNIKKAIASGREVIYVGTPNHPETIAMLSIDKKVHLFQDIMDDMKKHITDKTPFVSSQTTLSIYELENIFNKIKEIFPNAIFQKEICYETKARQEAIKKLPNDVDVVFIVGGKNSSNTKKLYEVAKKHFSTLKIYHILNEYDIDLLLDKIKGCQKCAIISGASTPLNETMKIKVKLDETW